MRYEIKVNFTITDFDINPDELSKLLNVQPSAQWQKGELISKKGNIRYKVNSWQLSSNLPEDAELEDQYNKISEVIREQYDNFKSICKLYDSELAITLYIYYQKNNDDETHNTPALHFDKPIINLLSQLNSEIDIDLYVLPEDD